jgi:hypothetical protein
MCCTKACRSSIRWLNLFLGLSLKLSPFGPELTFGAMWLALGFILLVVVYTLLRDLGVHRWPALVATAVIIVNPVTILYETHLSYEYPLAVGLIALALFGLRWARTGRLGWLVAAMAAAGTCVLTRSLLHPLWYVVVAGALVFARRPTGRWLPALAAIAVPLVLMAGVMAKNSVVFGTAQLSSLAGWNFGRVTVDELPEDIAQRLVNEASSRR